MRTQFTIDGIEYTFFPATMNGVEVIGISYTQNGESFGYWSAEPARLPEDSEEAATMLTNVGWDIVNASDNFQEISEGGNKTMKNPTHTYMFGPTYGKGSNPSGGEILIAPADEVNILLFDSPNWAFFTGKGTLSQVVPEWNRREAQKHDDGISRRWVWIYYRDVAHLDSPLSVPVDGGLNPLIRFFPGWRERL